MTQFNGLWESMRTPEEKDLDDMLEEHRSGDHPNNHRCPYCKEEHYQRDMYERRIESINQKAAEKLEPLRKALESLDVNQINQAFEQMTWKR